MTVSDNVKIGTDIVLLSAPCDVVKALKKMQLRLATGGVRETVRNDGEEVTFQRANDTRLTKMIGHYESECARLSGRSERKRFAKRFRFN